MMITSLNIPKTRWSLLNRSNRNI